MQIKGCNDLITNRTALLTVICTHAKGIEGVELDKTICIMMMLMAIVITFMSICMSVYKLDQMKICECVCVCVIVSGESYFCYNTLLINTPVRF